MPASYNTSSPGHVERALDFVAGGDVWMGYGVNADWPDEDAPPDPDVTAWNLGFIADPTYSGASLTDVNAFVTLKSCTSSGIASASASTTETYRVRGLADPANSYEVVRMSDSVVMATGLVGSATPNKTAVPGVAITVTASTITAGDYMAFTIDGPIGFVKMSVPVLVVEDDVDGIIIWNGTKWRVVSGANAYEEDASNVYVWGELVYDDAVVKDFRQVAVVQGLVRVNVGGVETELTPDAVANVGICYLIEHMEKVVREVGSREKFEWVLSFLFATFLGVLAWSTLPGTLGPEVLASAETIIGNGTLS